MNKEALISSGVGFDNLNIAKGNEVVRENNSNHLSGALLTAANMRIFLDEVKLPSKATCLYMKWKAPNSIVTIPMSGGIEKETAEYAQVKSAFDDLFKADDDPKSLVDFKNFHGEQADAYINIKTQIQRNFESRKEAIHKKSLKLNMKDRIEIALRIGKELPFLPWSQRLKILELAGYSEEEVKLIAVRLAISIPLYAGMFVSNELATDAVGLAGGYLFPVLNDVGKVTNATAVVGSALMYYGSKAALTIEIVKMAKNKKIKAVPSPTAVLARHTFEKMFPDQEKLVDWLTGISTEANPLELQKERWWGALLLPNGSSVFVAGNIAATVVNLSQYFLLRKYHSNQKNRDQRITIQ